LVLLAGNPGAGKTIFAAQYLYHGVLDLNEPGVYASLAEDRGTFLRNMKRLGMDFEKLEQDGKFSFMDLITVTEKGVGDVLTSVLEEIDRLKAKRLVIDSFSALAQAFKEPIDARIALHIILSKMVRQTGCTTLLTTEISMDRERIGLGLEEFVADGVITMTLSPGRGHMDRRLQVVKMRGTRANTTRLRYDITQRGIAVYPQLESRPVEKSLTERVKTGIEGLDAMLNGGFLKGSVTMVAGASGTGKTTTALHFVAEGAVRNERSLYISFEEPAAQLIMHGEEFGWNFKQLMDNGMLRIESYYLEPFNVGERLLQVSRLLQDYKPSRFVIDSLDALGRVMPEEECMQYVRNLGSNLKAEAVTSLLTMTGESTSPVTGTGVSTLMDNIISLRDVELESTLKRSLIAFKARGTAHDRDIREFEITPKGMIVKEKFVGMEQILGGAARRSFTEEAVENLARAFGKKR
jgi:circadian clock protein KaiC